MKKQIRNNAHENFLFAYIQVFKKTKKKIFLFQGVDKNRKKIENCFSFSLSSYFFYLFIYYEKIVTTFPTSTTQPWKKGIQTFYKKTLELRKKKIIKQASN